MKDNSRRIFLLFFMLASLLPAMFVVYIFTEYVMPLLGSEAMSDLADVISASILIMLLLPMVSFFLMWRWIRSLETVTNVVRLKSNEVAHREKEFSDQLIDIDGDLPEETEQQGDEPGEESEILVLINSFNSIFQTAADQLSERERLKELLAKLIVIASDLTSELDFDRLLPLVIARVTDVMAAERTSLYIIDWDKKEIWTKVSEGIQQIRLPLGKGISGRVAETGEMINVADAWELPYFDRAFDISNNFRTKSVLCVPIKSRRGERIGVLQVINKKDKEHFEEEDEIFLRGLSSQVAISLENSLLVDELWLSFASFISTLSATVDARHPLTAGHSARVTEYSLMISQEMHLTQSEMEIIKYASLLHDIGKIGIRDTVLLKSGSYTDKERIEMNGHPVLTRAILDKFRFPQALRSVPEIACHHHEKVNGEGYPDGLKGDDIPVGARIMAVADVFDALTSRREYPKYTCSDTLDCEPMPLPAVISILKDGAGSHFDPAAVEAFLRCLPSALTKYRGVHLPPSYVDDTLRVQGGTTAS